MGNAVKQLLEFGPFQVDPQQRLLFRDQQPISLSPKTFDLLLLLVQHSERVVLKDDLMKALWPDTFVEESNLGQHVFQLRKALGDRSQDSSYIVTVPGRGYRFAQSVRILQPEEELVVESNTRSHVVIEEVDVKASALALPSSKRQIRGSIAIAALVGLMVAGYFAWQKIRAARIVTPARIMLAVLPFQNLTGDPDQEYFADGLTEEMITKLGQLHPEQLGIIARTSVMGYKHGEKRLDQIGRELSVQYVLEGSFRRAANHLRITAQLIRVKDQSHLWAADYDRQPEDVVNLQDDVAMAVAQEIQLHLTPQERSNLTSTRIVNPGAYEAYLKGRFFWNKRTEDGFRKAIDYFEAAIAKDPNYAQAYAGLADTYMLLGGYQFEPQDEAMPKAKQAALRAIQIDDKLAEPYASLGLIYMQYEYNWAESEKSLKRALELNPNYSVAHHLYGDAYLASIGKTDAAISELRKAQELDPLSLVIATDLAKWLCLAGKFDEGMRRFQEVLNVDPNFTLAHLYRSWAYLLQKKYPDALAEIEKARSSSANRPYVVRLMGVIYADEGKRKEALEIISQLKDRSKYTYVDPGNLADIYAALGEKDQALSYLQMAYEQHSPFMTVLKVDPSLDPIRSDPRFVELIRKVGIP
jgi:TolB-like protein/DNA-binding winged helix-turn-helix (wHTH) protein/Tfp pilus assembly protein PilF